MDTVQTKRKANEFVQQLREIEPHSTDRLGLTFTTLFTRFCSYINWEPQPQSERSKLQHQLIRILERRFPRCNYCFSLNRNIKCWKLEFKPRFDNDSEVYIYKRTRSNAVHNTRSHCDQMLIEHYDQDLADASTRFNKLPESQGCCSSEELSATGTALTSKAVSARSAMECNKGKSKRTSTSSVTIGTRSHLSRRNRMNCPAHIHAVLNTTRRKFENALNPSASPMFITQQVRKVLDSDGFVVIPNVIRTELIEELKRYVILKMESEGVFDSSAYLEVGGPRHTIGLVTKYGWTKLDYTGPFQHILASDTGIYLLTCELLGATRLVPNFYEYKVSHPSTVKRKAGTKFEFIHVDGNYQKLLELADVGIDFTKLFYQIIVPITDMEPDGATVSFAKGFHKYWESVTRRALKHNCWTRRGWKATNPMKHIRKGDVDRYITSKWTPVTAASGSVIVFNSVLPHAPSMNKSGKVRIAGYNFYAPLISEQDVTHPERASSFLPNSLGAVRTSVS